MKNQRQIHLDQEAASGRIERRVIRPIELRAAAGDSGLLKFEGYACITDLGYDMYGGPPYGWIEIVARGAFKKTLSENPDVQLLINHTGLPLARTKSGTMTLAEDDIGLHTLADLDASDPDVQRLQPKMARHDLDEMSFAFRVVRQRWEDLDGNEDDPAVAPVRRILEVNIQKGDTSIVNYGANSATWGDLRSAVEMIAEAELDLLAAEARAVGDEVVARAFDKLSAARQRSIASPEPAKPAPLRRELKAFLGI